MTPMKADSRRPGARRARDTLVVLVPLWLVAVATTVLASLSIAAMAILPAWAAGESSWSKAQKDAVHALERYAHDGDERDYQTFLLRLAVPLSDRAARLEMNSAQPDFDRTARALVAGEISPDDVSSLIWSYRLLGHTRWLGPTVGFWELGDQYVLRLVDIGARLHALAGESHLDSPEAADLVATVRDIDRQLALVENGFSASLGTIAHQTRDALTLALALSSLLMLTGVTRFIRRALARSERLAAEVRRNEERLRLGFEGINAGLWDWDVERNTCYFSHWIYEQLGYDNDDGAPFDTPDALIQLVHAEDLARVRLALRGHLARRTPYDVEFRLRTLMGGYRWCRARGRALRDAQGVPVRMVGCLFDISELKTAEANAHTEKELAEVTLASIGDAVIRIDRAGRVTYCNSIAETMLGRPTGEILNQPFDAICDLRDEAGAKYPAPLVERLWERQNRADGEPVADLYVTRPDGARVAVDCSVSTMHDPDGQAIGTVAVLYDVSALREHAARLAWQASHDELTDLYNRREFERQLAVLLEEGAKTQAAHAVMFLDLDQLKVVNDTCGHSTGDELIRQVCMALRNALRSGDIIARLGGDEFGVVLPHCPEKEAQRIAETLREAISRIRFTWAGRIVQTSVSIGLVGNATVLASLKEVMKAVDVACYMAKEKGRNRVHRYRHDDRETSTTHTQMAWVADIKAAIENDHLCLYGQKIVPLAGRIDADDDPAGEDGEGAHVELLLRMRTASGVVVQPASFIAAAERYNLMPEIDRWVIANAFSMIAAGTHRFSTWSINLSGASLGDESLADYIEEQRRIRNIPFEKVCFEITETAAIINLQRAVALIERLRAQGCRFSLDDFGVGMSSFNYLKHLDVDYLKIDGSFIRGIVDSPLDQAIVRAINEIAHAAGKETIAEFVENEAIIRTIVDIGVDFAQGYGVGMPTPLAPAALGLA
ncbi:EAL domain-containing protein [Burkholderia sp. WAC0059]|uniref:EAL domain-containing protein n=1 Tax=Burkholderia sp. WAC0059 TaxID=2066022 RepID=UPI0015E0778F|nr:EAL domain-containing protein [Burkholderia sp. WAC0059]